MHSAMQELMKRWKSLMMKNHSIICQEFLCLKVIHQSYLKKVTKQISVCSLFLKYLCLKGYELIKKVL